jgi:hypothetical protein
MRLETTVSHGAEWEELGMGIQWKRLVYVTGDVVYLAILEEAWRGVIQVVFE